MSATHRIAGSLLRSSVVCSQIVLALACADSGVTGLPRAPFTITNRDSQTVQVARTLQMTAQGGDGAVTWESDDRAVAVVSASGLVTARFPGATRITARRGTATATRTVTATAARIDISPYLAFVDLGGRQPLVATVRDANGIALAGIALTWRTRNAAVATVDPHTGLLIGTGKGVTEVIADGGGASAAIPVYVSPNGARLTFSSIGSIGNHTCGLEAPSGLAYCWGDNHGGALGTGVTPGSDFPVPVLGGRHYSGLSVGYYATCGIETGTGVAYCWGHNEFGDLGDGSSQILSEPTAVHGGIIRFRAISASGDRTCGIEVQTGLGYCWGKGGLIGDGTAEQRSSPTLVGAGSARYRFSAISAGGNHACGIDAQSNEVYCWGENGSGQLGDGTTTNRLTPTALAGARHFSTISVGPSLSCGVELQTGLGYCWGVNSFGQVGDGTTSNRSVPALVSGGRRFDSISASGSATACGIEAQTGLAYCWGRYVAGGDNLALFQTRPVLVNPIMRFSSIVAAYSAGCGVEVQTGLGYCWSYLDLFPTQVPPAITLEAQSSRAQATSP